MARRIFRGLILAALLTTLTLERAGDACAIDAFYSNGRHEVDYTRFKDFEEHHGAASRARLAAMRGELSTRMGAAMRHAAHYLKARPADKKRRPATGRPPVACPAGIRDCAQA